MMDPTDRKSDTGQPGNWEKDLDKIQAAYSGLDAIEPPDLLDQMVLNTARRELSHKKRKPLRWIGAFATASVLVLSITIVLQQDQTPTQPARSNGIKLDSPSKKESVDGMTDSAGVQPSSPKSVDVDSGEDRRRMMKQSLTPTPAVGPVSRLANEPGAETDQMVSGARPEVFLEEISKDMDELRAPAPAATKSAQSFRDPAGELKVLERQDIADAEAEEDRAMDQVQEVLGRASMSTPDEERLPEKPRDPEEWVQHLLQLSQTSQHESLERELASFKQAYPDYELPPELVN